MVLAVHLIRTTSADYSAVLLQECVRELSLPNRPMNKEKKVVFASSRRREFSRLQIHGSSHVQSLISNGMEVFLYLS